MIITRATYQGDERFDILQRACDRGNATIAIGIPTKNEKGIMISVIIFSPTKGRLVYSRQMLY
ncbi:hypothetical protein C900_02020 [Fulvivirga imtechensis AK7]|uniref:Uncharacterized protein n=1 Tax=Fulvivirga imtechensis AK7 TaxID=1237149 RepID=L8JT56_9BACT|nr:hypothetical protein [Fulvivirga imtechensis]ELR72025.1 hypothetical protein C900_02020 [Fulvivirga imtechensis AK7]